MLHRASETVVLARESRQLLERLEIDRDVLANRPIRVDESAMSGTGLDADLAQSDGAWPPLGELAIETLHVAMQLVDVRVLAADLADLAANGHGHPVGLDAADEIGKLHRLSDVDFLLRFERRFLEVDQRRGVDVDVEEPRGNLF